MFPTLYTVAMDYLSIAATSVESECANSAAKLTLTDRERLRPSTLKVVIFPLYFNFNNLGGDVRSIVDETLEQFEDRVAYGLQSGIFKSQNF
jgi:hypothetical protein